jgi:hypothetical protein
VNLLTRAVATVWVPAVDARSVSHESTTIREEKWACLSAHTSPTQSTRETPPTAALPPRPASPASSLAQPDPTLLRRAFNHPAFVALIMAFVVVILIGLAVKLGL